MKPYPLTFRPILKQKVWGGRTLEQWGKVLPPGQLIGESWELADVASTPIEDQSIIANGALAGMTLRQALEMHTPLIMGKLQSPFPLLIKYLDAQENLSVQVHPSEQYVADHPHTAVKHEAWYILQSRPGAVIYHGLKPGVTRSHLLTALAEKAMPSVLNAVPVEAGQCYYLPSGTVHALGAGVTLAEIQTSSDWTFRLYDWGREDSPQRREMHIDQAMQCLNFEAPPPHISRAHPIVVDHVETLRLLDTPYFGIERISATADARVEIVTSGIAEVWMMLSGRGQITVNNEPILDIMCGMTMLMPAALSEYEPAAARVQRGSTFLRISLPSLIKGMIA